MNLSSTQSKPVWDIAVRLFHWSLVASFTIAYLSGEEESLLHIYSGYIVLGLVAFRILWGMMGSRHARFSDFIYSPRETIDYAKSMVAGKPKHYDGHNPLGSLMVFALLISLLTTTVTGLKVYGAEGHGPLASGAMTGSLISTAYASAPTEQYENAKSINKKEEHFWEEIHEFFANFTVFLIVFHIAGVVISSRLEKQNLAKAMITGRKQVFQEEE